MKRLWTVSSYDGISVWTGKPFRTIRVSRAATAPEPETEGPRRAVVQTFASASLARVYFESLICFKNAGDVQTWGGELLL